MNIIAKAHRYIKKTGSISGAAIKLGMPRSSLRRLIEKPALSVKKFKPIKEFKSLESEAWRSSV